MRSRMQPYSATKTRMKRSRSSRAPLIRRPPRPRPSLDTGLRLLRPAALCVLLSAGLARGSGGDEGGDQLGGDHGAVRLYQLAHRLRQPLADLLLQLHLSLPVGADAER